MWSVLVGTLITTGLYYLDRIKLKLGLEKICDPNIDGCFFVPRGEIDYGWPLRFNEHNTSFASTNIWNQISMPHSFLLNLLFWIGITWIILSLVKWMKYRNQNSKING